MFSPNASAYGWGGPATVRLIKTKYFSPQIDVDSHLTLYNYDRLAQAKEVLNLSDYFVTYSWGFGELADSFDFDFISARLPNFKKLDIRPHLYVQGLNVVTSDFVELDPFCHAPDGGLLPYSKGRSLTCPCNPNAIWLLKKRVLKAAQTQAAGVFVDNMMFGFPPALLQQDSASWFGCYCKFCQQEFRDMFGYNLPVVCSSARSLQEYLNFRNTKMIQLVKVLSQISHHHHKVFGINCFDPIQINPYFSLGYRFKEIVKYLDYILIENHQLPSKTKSSNAHLQLLKKYGKPILVVSYNQGIGFEAKFTQRDYDAIYTQSQQLGLVPCYKVSEFTTRQTWHTTDFENLKKVTNTKLTNFQNSIPVTNLTESRPNDKIFRALTSRLTPLLPRWYFNTRIGNTIGHYLFKRNIKSWRNYGEEW